MPFQTITKDIRPRKTRQFHVSTGEVPARRRTPNLPLTEWHSYQSMNWPPLMVSVEPVIQPNSSAARNTT